MANESEAKKREMSTVTLQLMWKHQFEFAGFYAAVKKGFYKDAGLQVDIAEYQSDMNVIDEVVSGQAQYGIHDASLLAERFNGKPVVLLSNIFQHSPMVLVSLASSGITSPALMIGKKVMLASHERSNPAIISMLTKESVSLNQLQLVEHSFNIGELINGDVDVMSSYSSNELGIFKQRGIAVNVINPINYGIDFYGNNLFTSEDEIAKHPLRVKSFVDASLKGWQYALDHPDEVIDYIYQHYSKQKSQELLKFEADAIQELVLPQHIKLGTIDFSRIRHQIDMYREYGYIAGEFSLEDYIYEGLFFASGSIEFSETEKKWIKQHPVITLGIDPAWPPFEFLDENNQYSGMGADYIHMVEKKTGLKVKIQDTKTWIETIDSARNRLVDVLPVISKTQEREQYLDFTKPHITYPFVILSDRDSRFISKIDDLNGDKVVVVDGYMAEDILESNHPGLVLLKAKNISQAVDMVSSGEAFALVDNLASISQNISDRGINNLRISGTTQYEHALSMAVPKGNEVLLSILQKTLDSLTEKEINQINQRWVVVQYTRGIDYSVLFKVIFVSGVIILLVFVWNGRLRGEIENRKRVEEKLQESEQRFRMLFEDNKAVELIVDPMDGSIIEANRAAIKFYGYTHEEMCCLTIDKVNALSKADVENEIQHALSESREHYYFQHRIASGEIRDVEVHTGPVQWGGKKMLYSIIHDVTNEKRLQKEILEKTQKLRYQASHDALTGLVNRREFERRLDNALCRLAQADNPASSTLIYMDLDQFKIVNDTAGHSAGDELLRKISSIIQTKVRGRDTLARLGGDEFGLLLENCGLDDAMMIAISVIQAVREFQFIWEDSSFRVGVSVGITDIDVHAGNMDEVLCQADDACYVAKTHGRNRYHVFDKNNEEFLRRKGEMWWTNEIIRAIEEDRLTLYYQCIIPISDVPQSGQHYEVLLRMIDTNGDLILPENFIPAAERYKLMPMIDRWVIAHLFEWYRLNPRQVDDLYQCSINLSGHSIGDKSFHNFLINAVKQSTIPADKICWEITETAAISHFKEAQGFIDLVRDIGCSFSLDDFGSGLSSFSYLKHLNADYLKIDGSFVKDMLTDPKDSLIVESIHAVGSGLGMKTIAEFVEDDDTADKLQEIGLDFAQGFCFQKPRPLLDLLEISDMHQIAT